MLMTLVLDETTRADESSHVERRRGLRIQQNRPVKIFDPVANRYVGGQTQDVSATGLRLELPLSSHVAPGRFLTIHVGLSAQGSVLANRRQMTPARVVWVDLDSDPSQPSTGIA